MTGDGIEVLSFGEALVDFLPEQIGVKLRDVERYTRCLGGAPANLAFGVAQLGGRSALMGAVGDDEFGHFLREHLHKAGVDVRGLVHTRKARTGIVFVSIDADGERSFTFYRHPSADMTIGPEEVNLDVIRDSQIVHSGTSLMAMPSPRAANSLALREAHKAGRLVSLDANIRAHHWDDPSQIMSTILEMLESVDMLKVNEEEAAFLFGAEQDDPRAAFEEVLAPRDVSALLWTYGGGGATIVTADLNVHIPAPPVEVVDTTGAGDGFLAGTLRALSKVLAPCGTQPGAWVQGMRNMDAGQWTSVLGLANHVGSQVCTRFGATTAIPTAQEIPWKRWF